MDIIVYGAYLEDFVLNKLVSIQLFKQLRVLLIMG